MGREGEDNKLLDPHRAIASSITGVLGLSDEERKKELLGDDAYRYAQKVASRFEEKDIEFFMDVVFEADRLLHYKNDEPFDTWKLQRQQYHISSFFDENKYNYNKIKNRFIAAKLRVEFFPTTLEFEVLHYSNSNN